MPNWTESMQQTFKYYIVDPNSWKEVKKIENVRSSSISRDSSADTLESASFDIEENIGEAYIRIYLVTNQNGVEEEFPLGTFLVQTPSTSFDGKTHSNSLDAYSPLLELKEKYPPFGFFIEKDKNIMDEIFSIVNDKKNVRAPVVKADSTKRLDVDFVADPADDWLTFLVELMSNAKYNFELDELGRILFAPKQETAALQPVWTFDDGNSSILLPEITLDKDLYGIPNVVEVMYSDGGKILYYRAVNDDPNSITSTVNRGREIVHRDTNPSILGNLNEDRIKEYAEELLRELSSIDCTVSYTHGYCPVRVGDCVRLNYTRAGITDIKARVISQNISCTPGCPVTEKAVYTAKLWR